MSVPAVEERGAPGGAGAEPCLELELEGLAWIVADLHLRADAAAEVAACAAALRAAPAGLSALVVLGDLFDAWVGPEQWDEPPFAPLRDALAELARRGTDVVLLRGNRDVWLEAADGAAVGGRVGDRLLVRRGEDALLLAHGDEFCLGDRSYQRLRAWLRRPWLRRLGRRLPYGLRRRLGASLRRASRRAVARKPLDTLALAEEAVAEALRRHGAAGAVIGHLHVDEARSLPGGGTLRIVPAWEPGQAPWQLAAARCSALTAAAPPLESVASMPAVRVAAHRPIVTLDGLAGSGKSTLARGLAERLGWTYLDSGAWYRAVAWAALEQQTDPRAPEALVRVLSRMDIRCRPDGTVVVGGRPLGAELRTPEIDAAVVDVADHPAVRAELTERMRRLRRCADVRGLVADGRDAGTVIFPDADLKVFVAAREEERARRRVEQVRRAGAEPEPAAVLAALRQRDARDAGRGPSAPRVPEGGRVLENSDLQPEEALERLLAWASPLLRAAGDPADPSGARLHAGSSNPSC